MPRAFRYAALALVVASAPALAAGLFGTKKGTTPPQIAAKLGKPIPASLLATLDKAGKAGLGMSQTPQPVYLKQIDGPRINKGSKVGVLYIGADFCPYCAGQRWALVVTLLRFGKFHNVEYMASSADDVYANTPTFSFQHATYESKYVDFQPVETANREGKRMQQPSQSENDIFNKFDAPPYSPSFGAIPFVYVDGQYLVTRPLVSPGDLTGMSWRQAAAALANPSSKVFQKAMPQINAFTAAICRLDGGNPDDVCSAPGVTAANGVLLNLGTASGS